MNVAHNVKSFNQRSVKPTSQIISVTPAMAEGLRGSAHFPRQRRIDRANVVRLAEAMVKGTFTPGTQIYLGQLPNGDQYVLNGNHTLEAVVASEKAQLLTITTVPVRSLDEAGEIYAVFDIQKRRSFKESLDATGKGEGIVDPRRVLSCMGIIATSFTHKFTGGGDRLALINMLDGYKESAEIFAQCIKGAPKANGEMLKRAPVMAVALETIKHQPSAAEDFWTKTAHDDGLPATAPEKALLNWLRNNRANGETARRMTTHAAASAWNAAWKGEERKFIKPSSMTTFFILGTPWDQGRGDA